MMSAVPMFVRPEIKHYISDRRRRGMSDEEIIRELTLHGWREQDALAAVAEVSPSRKLTLILLVCILVVAAAAAGFWYASVVKEETSTSNVASSVPTANIPEGKACEQDSDCGLLTCSGCYNQDFIATAPPDLACTVFEGYSCVCRAGTCTEIAPEPPAPDTNSTVPSNVNASAAQYDFPEVTTKEECVSIGAEWISVGNYRCELPAPDAGSSCTSSSQCIRLCVLSSVTDKTGTCSAHSRGGCIRYFDKDGQLQAVCID